MKKPSLYLYIFIINFFLIGCTTNSRWLCDAEIEHTYEGCYMSIDGKDRLMTCPRHLPDLMSQEKIDNSMELFLSFLKSPKAKVALNRSVERDKAGIVKAPSNFLNEGDEIDMMVGRHYIARMSFRVNPSSSYFTKRGGNPFKQSEEPLEKWIDRILTNVLGQGYERFSPNLTNVNNESVNMDVLFSDAYELKILLRKRNLVSIRHIGNPIYALEEVLH